MGSSKLSLDKLPSSEGYTPGKGYRSAPITSLAAWMIAPEK